jgi:hypothetical protein
MSCPGTKVHTQVRTKFHAAVQKFTPWPDPETIILAELVSQPHFRPNFFC